MHTQTPNFRAVLEDCRAVDREEATNQFAALNSLHPDLRQYIEHCVVRAPVPIEPALQALHYGLLAHFWGEQSDRLLGDDWAERFGGV